MVLSLFLAAVLESFTFTFLKKLSMGFIWGVYCGSVSMRSFFATQRSHTNLLSWIRELSMIITRRLM